MAQSSQLGLSRQQVKNLRFRDLYLSGSTIDLGGTKISRDAASGGITIASASGGTVDSRVKNLFADGTITASNLNIIGDYVTMQTTTSNTEMMVIENAGTGPALKVTQTGANSIAEFYDDGNVLALKVADGGNVGIGTSAPLQKLDVIGTVQATGFSGSGALVTSLNVDNVSLGSLAVARGGTNIQSYTVGDLIYATGATALSKLADVATGNALISGGVGAVPEWGKIGLTTHVSGTLGVANGGTGAASLTANKVLVGNGTSGVLQPTNLHWDDTNSRLGIGTTTPRAEIDIAGTSAMVIPNGTSAQLPLSPVQGMFRLNTTTNRLQFYSNYSGWTTVGGVSAAGGNSTNDINGYRIHTFTSSGTFIIYTGGILEVLIVAGGGGGGSFGGGGGAGGIAYTSSLNAPNGSLSVVVGGGGTGRQVSDQGGTGDNGGDSSFYNIVAKGGGGGGSRQGGGVGFIGTPGAGGGSGGGGSHADSGTIAVGGASTQQSYANVAVYGTSGGKGKNETNGSPNYASGGGGGASIGGTYCDVVIGVSGGKGGTGIAFDISGSSTAYGGGGGGGVYTNGTPGVGGSGGGGAGAGNQNGMISIGENGSINKGGGGGGGGYQYAGGNGGSGIVIIRYLL